jgi:hypothetical protein
LAFARKLLGQAGRLKHPGECQGPVTQRITHGVWIEFRCGGDNSPEQDWQYYRGRQVRCHRLLAEAGRLACG